MQNRKISRSRQELQFPISLQFSADFTFSHMKNLSANFTCHEKPIVPPVLSLSVPSIGESVGHRWIPIFKKPVIGVLILLLLLLLLYAWANCWIKQPSWRWCDRHQCFECTYNGISHSSPVRGSFGEYFVPGLCTIFIVAWCMPYRVILDPVMTVLSCGLCEKFKGANAVKRTCVFLMQT